MTAVVSPGSSPATSPPAISSPVSSTAHPALPPLITASPPPTRRSNLPRPMSQASKNNRLSQHSAANSVPSRSRPASGMFPAYPSSLPYTLVRDFAYPPSHPMHYGPPPEPSRPPSGMFAPESGQRSPSDAPGWDTGRAGWSEQSWASGGFPDRPADLPAIRFGDGPPWSEDEDLQSPVVSSRHRKHKSSSAGSSGRRRASRDSHAGRENGGRDGGSCEGASKNGGGSGGGGYQGAGGSGPGGDDSACAADRAGAYQLADQQPRGFGEAGDFGSDDSSTCSSPGYYSTNESRYSRDYQFTITSPDEEMHGKAVALFDFERENESELPLVEGQIIWVSYRYGQGWLVAEDPKTQESGLVPEEYVRLLRDIEGGLTSLAGNLSVGDASPAGPGSDGGPIVSTFSTSSKDLDPYPQHLLGTQAGQPPPQVVHYHGQRGGSQGSVPTALSAHQGAGSRRASQDTASSSAASGPNKGGEEAPAACLETLPDAKLERPESRSGSAKKRESR
ncbi:hypothetical protein VTH06DRAFT_4238 [Thermothelomyces fergusii]